MRSIVCAVVLLAVACSAVTEVEDVADVAPATEAADLADLGGATKEVSGPDAEDDDEDTAGLGEEEGSNGSTYSTTTTCKGFNTGTDANCAAETFCVKLKKCRCGQIVGTEAAKGFQSHSTAADCDPNPCTNANQCCHNNDCQNRTCATPKSKSASDSGAGFIDQTTGSCTNSAFGLKKLANAKCCQTAELKKCIATASTSACATSNCGGTCSSDTKCLGSTTPSTGDGTGCSQGCSTDACNNNNGCPTGSACKKTHKYRCRSNACGGLFADEVSGRI